MIPFNMPPYTGKELDYMAQAVLVNHKLCGDGPFTKRCHKLLEEQTGAPKVLLTTSGSHALELAALLCDLKPGDEVILPSYTFVSTANAFVLVGAVPVFVDIRPDTMNIDETKIEAAVTDKTKVICVVHYAGIGCEMDTIMDIARRHNLKVVEDAAQGVNAFYKGRALGTIGDFGCYSFHETKNYSMGEGGAVLINDPALIEKAEIIREKGTNRSRFLRGQVDKYTWVEYGSSYLPSELNAAHLLAQLEVADERAGPSGVSSAPCRVQPQRPHVCCQAEGSGRADCIYRVSQGPGHRGQLPLCAPPYVSCRREVGALPRRGCLYNEGERAADPSAHVLPDERGRSGDGGTQHL